MAKEKTLNDIALNQVLSTDRLESAMENNTNKIIQAIEDIGSASDFLVECSHLCPFP